MDLTRVIFEFGAISFSDLATFYFQIWRCSLRKLADGETSGRLGLP